MNKLQNKRWCRCWLLFRQSICCLISFFGIVENGFALTDHPDLSVATISDRLMGTTQLFASALTGVAGVIGVGLLVSAVMQYLDHRRSPSMVRLSTPIIFSILGAILTILPAIAEHSAGAQFLLTIKNQIHYD